MRCPHCGRNIPDGSIFCLYCQEDISEEDRLKPKKNEKMAELDLTYRGIYFSDIASHWNWALEQLSSDINSQLGPWFDNGWKIKNAFLLPSYLTVIRGQSWKAIGIDIAISAIFRTETSNTNYTRINVIGAKIPMIRDAESNNEELFYNPKNWYGFEYIQTDAEVKKTFSCYYDGFLVYIVTPNSPAQMSGLKFGDVIYKIDEKEVKTISDFNDALVDASISKGTTIFFFRRGTQHQANVFPDYPPWF
jgi:hypothetical protein